MKLTKTAIDQAKFSDSKKETYILWDDALPGFGIRIYPSGRKSFVISYRMQGKKRIMVLGAYGRLTLDQAR
ncbi:MAG TPA: Arm DNA-binding domain-containing protein, partial [bacterium]|nr:Arm DNA-binding domain-containing protein [bacterium]